MLAGKDGLVPQASFTKWRDIYVNTCNISADLFPISTDPSDWASCHDAYEYTWKIDFNNDIVGLTDRNLLKLVNSMGFCPHNRCQLGNLSSADSVGNCPAGLCYTKLENGARSFGACCFIDGMFNTGALIGYYNKTQSTAKPIYK